MKYIGVCLILINVSISCRAQDNNVEELKSLDIKASSITGNFRNFYKQYGIIPKDVDQYLDSIKYDEEGYAGFKKLLIDPFSKHNEYFNYVLIRKNEATIGFIFISRWKNKETDFKTNYIELQQLETLLPQKIVVPREFELVGSSEIYWTIQREMTGIPKLDSCDIWVGLYIVER